MTLRIEIGQMYIDTRDDMTYLVKDIIVRENTYSQGMWITRIVVIDNTDDVQSILLDNFGREINQGLLKLMR